MNAAWRRPPEILVVEDNAFDCYLLRRAFAQVDPRANLHHVTNGEACLRFLRHEEPYATAPEPDLILMDLDMPVMNGREALAAIARDEALVHLPVVILTSREDVGEVMRMYRLRCSSYICKPLGIDAYLDMVGRITDYWLRIVELPQRQGR